MANYLSVNMMKIFLRRVLFPAFFLAISYVIVSIVVERVTVNYVGWFEEGRMLPYYSIHLSEEYAEGTYSPYTDPVFLSYIIASGILSFGCSGFYAAWGVTRRYVLFSAIPAFLGAGLFIFFHADIIFSPPERMMKNAALLQIFIYLLSAFLGICFGIGINSLRGRSMAEGHQG